MAGEDAGAVRIIETTLDGALRLAADYEKAGRLAEAEAVCCQILAIYAANPMALHLLGVVRLRAGNVAGAVEVLEKALAGNPSAAPIHHLLGLAYAGVGRHAEAVTAFETALAAGENTRVLIDLGVTLSNLGRNEAAAQRFSRALELSPDSAEAWAKLGRTLGLLRRHEEAVRHLTKAIELAPDIGAEAYYDLGVALKSLGHDEPARVWFENAVHADPDHTRARSNLGTTLLDLGRLNEAVHCFREGVARAPRSPDLHYNLGNALLRQRRVDKAIETYRQALALSPDSADAHWNLAHALLLSGDFDNGWREYQWRWGIAASASARRAYDKPSWDGTPLDGRTILLWAEQGFGDSIQFVRYVPWVAAKGGTVVLECWTPLKRLFADFPGVARMIEPGTSPGAFDVQLALLSLPLVHGTTLATIPADIPYLKADPVLVDAWRARLETDRRLKVGLSWQGNRGHPRDRERSVPLTALRPLLDMPEVAWFSLQKEDDPALFAGVPADVAPIRPRLPTGESIRDFADTAAIIANMDLVVSVDSAAAHLAGALAHPVWLLLPFVPEWRWLLNRPDSPWYPTMRLFRQSSYGDWNGVVRDVRDALRTLVAG